MRAKRGGDHAHHHRVAAGGHRVTQAHQPGLQFLAAQAGATAHAECVNHACIGDTGDGGGKTRCFKAGQVLAQGGFDVVDNPGEKRRLLRRRFRMQKAAADAAGLGQLQAQVAQIPATDTAREA